MRKIWMMLLILMVIAVVGACGKKAETNTGTGTGTGAAAGGTGASTGGTGAAGGGGTVVAQAVFKANCVSCHGANLEGGMGPNLTKTGGKYSKDQIAGLIANGKGAMPGFKGKLTDGEINGLADWLAAKK
jgi:cytochrome c551